MPTGSLPGPEDSTSRDSANRVSATAAFRVQLRDNPVIWVLFIACGLMLIPIQSFTPLTPPYQEADTWAQVIATLLVALAFDTRLDIAWLVPARSRQEAHDRNEWMAAIVMLLLIVIAAGLLVTMYMTGWKPEDEPVPEWLGFLPVAALGAELFLLMVSFYLRASNPSAREWRVQTTDCHNGLDRVLWRQ